MERRALRDRGLSHVQRDAGVALRAMPVAPVALDLAQPHGQLVHGRLDLLEAEDVGLLPVDEFLELRLASANAVDVPGCDFHRGRAILSVPFLPEGTACTPCAQLRCVSRGSLD